ncbi:PR-1-like protein [Aspergillus campestris IBT 28561]|uniref:PR-1-like protein n=1 Tax=Aspergillus campestris (strain IBT 28561) TaxID=1392248 RepID=A0A2I1DG09_ASPC2|nr:PR-1-like protein [Aspergillus campestris IBT 28561]PKY08802.1 PR-1-like protein [Aspergillus campestris IBT 28561]
MRSVYLWSALCAAVAVSAAEKREYTTEWTVVTVTTTITAPLPPSTPTNPPVPGLQDPDTSSSSSSSTHAETQEPPTAAPAPVVTTIVDPPQPAPTDNQPAPPPPTDNPQPPADGQATTWTSSWSSEWTITGDAPQPTTMSTTTSADEAKPTNDYMQHVLYSHNVHRSNHSSNSLEWDSKLESSAEVLAKRCVYKHDPDINGGGYGQNIGYGVKSDKVAVMISNLMYNNEMGFFESLYGQDNPDQSNFHAWGHFTQIVWKGTTHVGCSTVVCPSLGNVDGSDMPFTVCNYGPAGNFDGEYAANVLRPQGHKMYSA